MNGTAHIQSITLGLSPTPVWLLLRLLPFLRRDTRFWITLRRF